MVSAQHDWEVQRLVDRTLAWLTRNQCQYCIERNYQGYPRVITGDVDLIVAEEDLNRATDMIKKVARELKWKCYFEHRWERLAHIGFYHPAYPRRFALVFELFCGAGWKGATYLDSAEILRDRVPHGEYWKPRAAHQAAITLFHHLLYNREVPLKYRDEIHAKIRDDSSIFVRSASEKFGEALAKRTLKRVLAQEWEQIAADHVWYKLILFAHSILLHPVSFFRNVVAGCRVRYRSQRGVMILVDSPDERRSERFGEQLLAVAKQWHLFLPYRRLFKLGRTVIKAARRIVSRGGTAIVIREGHGIMGAPKGSFYQVSLRPARMDLFSTSTGETVDLGAEFGEADVESDEFLDALARRVWNEILSERASE